MRNVQRRDTDSGRFYDIDGCTYPSVTSILSAISKPALTAWSANVEREMVIAESWRLYRAAMKEKKFKVPSTQWALKLQDRLGKERANRKILRQASEIGSQAHAMIEWTLRNMMCEKQGPSPSIGEKATWAFTQWLKWKDSVRLNPILIEKTVHSHAFGYAGTMDLLAEVNGELAVVDWKTGKAIYPEALLQNAAYREATREMGLGNPVKGIIVRLPKVDTDPEFETKDAGNEAENLTHFLNVKRVWEWTQAQSKNGAGY
jgi:hypothetical protein